MNKNIFLEKGTEKECCGCSSCAYSCPTKAIEMREDTKGFIYPHIDNEKCINCGKCKAVCPVLLGSGHKVDSLYAFQNSNEEDLKNSQSGGFFSAISDYVLDRKGVVYGALFDEKFLVKYERADTYEDRNLMRMSKYVQAKLDNKIYIRIHQDLEDGKLVLFSGTPCHVYAIKKAFENYDNLITLDFLCHGVTSPKVWEKYLNITRDDIGPFDKVVFRNPVYEKKGWHSEGFTKTDGSEYISNRYAGLYYTHAAHREACFECKFSSEERYSDITMAWFIDDNPLKESNKYPVSMAFINTEKGNEVFEKIKNNSKYQKVAVETHFKNQPTLYHPIGRPDYVDDFWNNFSSENWLDSTVTESIIKKHHLGLFDCDKPRILKIL